MTPEEYLAKAKLYKDLLNQNKFALYFPDEDQPGYHARSKYPRHLEFFEAGKKYFSRLACAAIGVGKTEGMGGYETVCHLTGLYPEWWKGHWFDKPIDCWIAGDTKETTRDIQQTKLFGKPYEEGTGLIPKDYIIDITRRANSNGAIDTFIIRHKWGKKSYGGFKSYDQGVDSFFGTEKDLGWLDELAPFEIYSQMVARTRNRPGARIITTFSPIKGRTELVKLFLEETDPSRTTIFCGWDDAPHLDEQWKKNTLANTPVYLRDAVSLGVPTRGAGAIYPISEDRFVIDPIKIPNFYRKVYGFDGGHNTAFIFGAWDKDNDIVYIISEYKDVGQDISVHAGRIKMRLQAMKQVSMPGVGDYSGTDTSTGTKILDLYKAQGLRIKPADKGVDVGIQEVLERLQTGRLKVFRTCSQWLQEFRTYSSDLNQKIIKKDDHLMDATRYLIRSGLKIASPPREDYRGGKSEEQTFGLYG